MTRAVVFAYHDVGVRCLQAVLAAGVQVPLVVTHEDQPGESIWFGSVADLARRHGLRCIAPADANSDAVVAACREAAPDLLFSFYCRQMLGPAILALPRLGAYNLHGSLLPRHRGRAPVNWAILHGERETGATLHVMDVKPDHGAIVDQEAVPILEDDTARQVMDKVAAAGARVVARSVPRLIDGTAVLVPQRHLSGQYFGGRRPEDGRIPPLATARRIHDLVRAVAPPEYPGAFFDSGARRIVIGRTHVLRDGDGSRATRPFALQARDGGLTIESADGGALQVLAATLDGRPLDAAGWAAALGGAPVSPDPITAEEQAS
jgi:methionyl-tRNA formyltransferase